MPPTNLQRFGKLMRACDRDPNASRAVVGVLRAYGRVAKALERALLPAQLTLPKFNVLMELAASPDGSLPLYELTGRLVGSPPNTSALISRMEEEGLVSKCSNTLDARVRVASITEHGWSQLEQGAALVFRAERILVRDLERADLRRLPALLDRLIRSAPHEQ